ncbi:MAG TPA: hypothetical protein PLT93_17945 [Phycisphaerae bacterium]|nr:hypothetical protein [Phycisphaerae bacterium]
MTDLLENGDVEASHCAASLPGAAASEARWSVWRAFWAAGLGPATTARHLAHVGLLKAFAVHAASVILLVFGATVVAAAVSEDSTWVEIWDDIFRDMFGLGVFAATIEAGTLVLALLLVPWGAREEKLQTSLRWSMRTVWQQSMHVAVASLALHVLVSFWERFLWKPWYAAYTPALNSGVLNWSARPWYVRHADECAGYVGVLLYAWVLWGLLRAVGSRPLAAPADATPACQLCGYNLTGAATEGACPECGESVAASIMPDSRPGVLWERRGALSRRQAWWQTAWQAIRTPRQFGRQMQVYSPPAAYRQFLLPSMVGGALIGMVGVLACYAGLLQSGRVGSMSYEVLDDLLWLVLPVAATACGISILTTSLFFAGTVGAIMSLANRRNLLPLAMRCAAYTSGFLLLWMAANVLPAFIYGLAPGTRLFQTLAAMLQADEDDVVLLLWGVFNLFWLAAYVRKLHAMIQGARFATR